MTRPSRRRSAATLLAVAIAVGALAGCADVERAAVTEAADAFAADLREDPAAACGLLAPSTLEKLEEEAGSGCPEALPGSGLSDPGERLGVSVAGHSAQARFAQDTVFLALFADGWKVVAAGCERGSSEAADPYDCDVDGS